MSDEQFAEMMKVLRAIDDSLRILTITTSIVLTDAQANLAAVAVKKLGLA